MTKRVIDASDHNQKNVLRNCGMWGISLADKQYGPALLAEINWGGANLFVVDWESVKLLGDEHQAHQPKYSDGKMKDEVKDKARRVIEYRWAVRANRQLAAVLRDQGFNEEADSFAYRAQRLRRIVWRRGQRPRD